MEGSGPKSGEVFALAVNASDLTKAGSVPLPLETFTNADSEPVVADGHLFVVQQLGTVKWRLISWGI